MLFNVGIVLAMTESPDSNARRRQFLQSFGIAGAVGLAGCVSFGGDDENTAGNGGDGDSSGGDSSGSGMADSAEGWSWDIAARSLQNAAEMYNEENGTDISVEELGGDSWENRFDTAVASGSGAPDFTSVQNFDTTNYASIGGLMDLTERIEETDMEDEIVDGKWETVTYDGSYYAIPWDLGPTGVFYRRDVYEDAGIDPDSIETWDDFVEAGQQLPDDVAMINLGPEVLNQEWRMRLRQLGGQAFTEDGAVNVHSEESVRAAQQINDIAEAGIHAQIEEWSGGWFTAYAEGTVASLASGAWMDGTIRAELPDTAGDWGVYKLPAFEEGGTRASNRGGSNMAIPSQLDDEAVIERAFDFCQWAMTEPDVQNMMLDEFGLFPSLTTAYDADIYDEELDFYDGQPVFRLFAEVAREIEPYRYTTASPEVDDAIVTELGNMIDGNKSPEQAVQDAAETVADRTDRELA